MTFEDTTLQCHGNTASMLSFSCKYLVNVYCLVSFCVFGNLASVALGNLASMYCFFCQLQIWAKPLRRKIPFHLVDSLINEKCTSCNFSPLFLSLTLSLLNTHLPTRTHTLSLSLLHTRTLSNILPHTHTITLSLLRSFFLSLTISHTCTLSHTLSSHTHTDTHTHHYSLSISFSFSLTLFFISLTISHTCTLINALFLSLALSLSLTSFRFSLRLRLDLIFPCPNLLTIFSLFLPYRNVSVIFSANTVYGKECDPSKRSIWYSKKFKTEFSLSVLELHWILEVLPLSQNKKLIWISGLKSR